jgi:DnaK suppressor protein
MSMATNTVASRAGRFKELEAILESRRFGILSELQDRIRALRSDGVADRDVREDVEKSELDLQDDIGFALIELKTEMLNQIDAAIRRLHEGNYGDCFECGGEIAEARLRALPFAVRCRECEHSHEAQTHANASRNSVAPFRHPSLLWAPRD